LTLNEFMQPADVAREADPPVTPATVRRWCDSGELPCAARTPTGGRLFARPVVEAFLKARAEAHAMKAA
jgi:DNA-binding transcriptional MerR regulator